jgi:hypothetical protein
MSREEFLQSKYFKILLPLLVVWGIIVIFKGGYAFGQWLYAFQH